MFAKPAQDTQFSPQDCQKHLENGHYQKAQCSKLHKRQTNLIYQISVPGQSPRDMQLKGMAQCLGLQLQPMVY